MRTSEQPPATSNPPLAIARLSRDVLTDGRRFRLLAVVHDFDPEYPALGSTARSPAGASPVSWTGSQVRHRRPVMMAARLLEFSRERSMD